MKTTSKGHLRSQSHKEAGSVSCGLLSFVTNYFRSSNKVRAMGDSNVAALVGQPALLQLVNKFATGKSDSEKKEMIKKIETQLVTFNGKEKLTVDEFYSVLKVQFKLDCTKNDIRKVVADLPMDKNYKIVIKDFSRLPILSDDVFKAMDKNNDGQVSKERLLCKNLRKNNHLIFLIGSNS